MNERKKSIGERIGNIEPSTVFAGLFLSVCAAFGFTTLTLWADGQIQNPTPIPTSTPNCAIDKSPIPSERIYSNTLPDGSISSLMPTTNASGAH